MSTTITKSHPFTYLAWSGTIGLVLILAITVIAVVCRGSEILCAQYGPMKNMEIAVWLLSALAAAIAYRRWTGRVDRIMAFWVTLVSCLACLRAADAHVLMAPENIKQMGIAYGIHWLIDPQAGSVIKLAYAGLFIIVVVAVFSPLLFMRSRFWRLTRAGDAGIGMILVAIAGLTLGYLLAGATRIAPLATAAGRELTRETGHFLAALAFLAASILLCKSPVSERLKIPEK